MAGRETQVASPRTGPPVGGPRRTRVVIRRVGPLSVLRWSLFFYFCVFLIIFFSSMIIFGVLESGGVLDSVGRFLGTLGLGSCQKVSPESTETTCNFAFNSGWIFPRFFVFGAITVCVWSVINVLVVFLYNLVSDVIGGVEMTFVEKR